MALATERDVFAIDTVEELIALLECRRPESIDSAFLRGYEAATKNVLVYLREIASKP